MNIIVRHIEWLLTTHDCVIIPRVGAVLAHCSPARLSDDGRLFMPPCRVFTFNSSLTLTDGLVENSIARSLGVSHERAAAIVADDVDTMLHQLRNDSALSLGRIGTLRFDRQTGAIDFEPFRVDSITHLASWLPETPLAYFSARREDPRAEVAAPTPALSPSPFRRFVRATAAAAAIVAIAFVASTPITVADANHASTALPPVSAPRPAYVPSMQAPLIVMPAIGEQQPVDTAARFAYQRSLRAPKEQQAPVQAAPAALRFRDTDRYCVIVGSLNSRAEADAQIARISRNFEGPVGVLSKDGRFRIYAATGASLSQANDAAARLASRFPGAWVCSK